MPILNFGSINIDHVYRLATLPHPGETIAAASLETGLGGKGANQSIAIARAGGTVRHLGAIGPGGGWTRDLLANAGVDVSAVADLDTPTGHAMIMVDNAAENAIVLFKGANHAIAEAQVCAAMDSAAPGDWFLMQNETNASAYAAKLAHDAGLRVAYCAAPFVPEAVREVLPYVELLSVNALEEAQLRAALPDLVPRLDRMTLLVTYGADGAAHISPAGRVEIDAFKVVPVDTTGAGDTFLGYALAGFDAGLPVATALRRAAAASAIQVTRPGAAAAIPLAAEVDAFLAERF
ncbi:MAG: ribokinase [Rhodobacteraceae bacterium]|nr:ribokinase [Paracoccaceae bacterium]